MTEHRPPLTDPRKAVLHRRRDFLGQNLSFRYWCSTRKAHTLTTLPINLYIYLTTESDSGSEVNVIAITKLQT